MWFAAAAEKVKADAEKKQVEEDKAEVEAEKAKVAAILVYYGRMINVGMQLEAEKEDLKKNEADAEKKAEESTSAVLQLITVATWCDAVCAGCRKGG